MSNFIVPGFRASSIASGIKEEGKKDLGLIFSKTPVVTAGVFTTNKIKAAPLLITRNRLKNPLTQALLVNSGNANACTGRKGLNQARRLTDLVGKLLDIPSSSVLVSSTGVIGELLPLGKIEKNLPLLIENLRPDGLYDFAQAIMTTDTFSKLELRKEKIQGKEITIGGIAKGAGMIMPQMATMLCFVLTDICIELQCLKEVFKTGIDQSFNQITIDGETSTNDMALILASGRAENDTLNPSSKALERFRAVLAEVLLSLAKMVIEDGEGATKFIEIAVEGAKSEKEAKKIAYSIANSNLVKTSFFGEEVNWGRIMAAIGRAGARVNPDRIDISFDQTKVVRGGVGTGVAWEKKAQEILRKRRFQVIINLNRGGAKTRVFTSDLSPEYVKINASYRS